VAAALFIVVVLLAVAGGIWSYQQAKKRRQALQQYALANRWTYIPRDDSQCMRWQRSPFDEGFDRRALNVLRGTFRSHDMLAFDYQYKTRTTDGEGRSSTQTHHYRICALALPTWLPYLEVGPENVLTRLGGAVGLRDIELESEDFNRKFRVHANDAKFAYDVLSARTMAALLAQPAGHWRIDGNTIVGWATGALAVPQLLAGLNTLATVVDGIPDFVWHDNGVPAAPPPATPQTAIPAPATQPGAPISAPATQPGAPTAAPPPSGGLA
jgi:hypothetical protein